MFFQVKQFFGKPLTHSAPGRGDGDTGHDLYCGVGLFTLPLAISGRIVEIEAAASGEDGPIYTSEAADAPLRVSF